MSFNNTNIEFREESLDKNNAVNAQTQDCSRPISRNEIKSTLNKIYAEETKPVDVKSIKLRTEFALMSIIFGTAIIIGIVGFQYLALESNLMLIGIILLLILLPIGFLLSTKNIRKIYFSMSRFKNADSPSYRTVLPKARLQNGIVYAALLCLILLGAQSVNFMIFGENGSPMGHDGGSGNDVVFRENAIWFDDVTFGEPEQDLSGQYYRKITAEINNSIGYYSKSLVFEVQSWFAGKLYDKANVTLNTPDSDKTLPIRIHEPDDTTIRAYLKKTGIAEPLDDKERRCDSELYIARAEGKITETSTFEKSIEITVVIYNDRIPTLMPGSLSVRVNQGILKIWRDPVENEKSLKKGESWQIKFNYDILDEETIFEVELRWDDESTDKAIVDSS